MGLINSFLLIVIIFILVGGGTFTGFAILSNDDSVRFLEDEKYNSVTFSSNESALKRASEIGCDGFHIDEQENKTIYMACEGHADLDPIVEILDTISNPCYQEFADQPNDCAPSGGEYIGGPSQVKDGNWLNKYSSNSFSFEIIYEKPKKIEGATIQWKSPGAGASVKTVIIPGVCLNPDDDYLKIKYHADNFCPCIKVYCYDGIQYQEIGNSGYIGLWEEGIWWHLKGGIF